MVERRDPITLRPEDVIPHLLTEYGRWHPEVFSSCSNSLTKLEPTNPDRHIILAMASAQACLNDASKLDYVRETWQVTEERIAPGQPSQHYERVRSYLWSKFSRTTDSIAGGIVGAAEIACSRLKNVGPKSRRWEKAWFKIVDDAGLGGHERPMPEEFRNIVERWAETALAYKIYYKSPDMFENWCSNRCPGLEPPE